MNEYHCQDIAEAVRSAAMWKQYGSKAMIRMQDGVVSIMVWK